MKIAILCLLLVPFLHGATIQQSYSQASIEVATTVQPHQLLGRSKRFLFDDDDYEYWFGRRRPSRRTMQLARMIQQLSGSRGLNQAQLLNMLRDLQSLQALTNMTNLQQLMQLQNLQAQSTTQPIG